MSFSGRGNSNGELLSWDGSTQVWTPNTFAVQTFEIGVADTIPVFNNPFSAFGILKCCAIVPASSAVVTQMASFWSQAGGNAGMGIYDALGNLLGNTAQFLIIVGANVANLGVPIQLIGGQLYYLGLTSNGNGSRNLNLSGRVAGTPLPSIGFQVPNPYSGNPEGFPATVATGSQIADRPWIAAGQSAIPLIG